MSEGARVKTFHIGDAQFAVLGRPSRPAPPAGLTGAEREVFGMATSGMTNAAIAAARGTSPRTVANQLLRIYRKCSVRSRVELIARFAGAGREGDRP